MAGESAREYARRQREKAERHLRVAENYERGAEGEAATARVLDSLVPHGWVVFHDVRWPGRPRANIDHVVIGPGGVFVIDSKNWSGRVAVTDNVLVHDGRRREQVVAGAGEAALAITQLLGQVPATGVLCFVRDEPLTGWARDVMICSTSSLTSMLASRPPTLHPAAVQRFARWLSGSLRSATLPGPTGQRHYQAPTPVYAAEPRVWHASASRRPRRTPNRETKRNAPGPLRALLGLAMLVIGLCIGLPLVLHAMTSAVGNVITSTTGPSVPIGTAISVPGTTMRPELRVTAINVLDAKPARGTATAVPPGRHLVAVQVRLENEGDRGWSSAAAGTSWAATDRVGTRYEPLGLRRVDVGKTLPRGLRVPPHGAAQGLVVFAIPRQESVAGIHLAVGPGVPKEVSWAN